MAQFRTIIRTDLDRTLNPYTFGGKMFTQDNKANRIDVYLYRDNAPVTAGGSIIGLVKRNDGKTIAFPGGIDEGVAYIELPESAYAVEGPIAILIRNTDGDLKTVIGECYAYVTKTADADYVTSGTVVVSIQELVDKLDLLEPLVDRINNLDTNNVEELEEKLEELETKLDELDAIVERNNTWESRKINSPTTNPYGTAGQMLRTNGDGTTEWANVGTPTDEQTEEAVQAWLDNHPEATTTVQDEVITEAKLHSSLTTKLNTAITYSIVDECIHIQHLQVGA